ncbi:MAG: YraN family protein, partial [Alphaproteobacteria bacterium]
RARAGQARRARPRARSARAAAGFLAARPGLAGLEARFDAMVFGAWPWPRHVVDAWRDSP